MVGSWKFRLRQQEACSRRLFLEAAGGGLEAARLCPPPAGAGLKQPGAASISFPNPTHQAFLKSIEEVATWNQGQTLG